MKKTVLVVICCTLVISLCSCTMLYNLLSYKTVIKGAQNYYDFWKTENVTGMHCTHSFDRTIPAKAFPAIISDDNVKTAEFSRIESIGSDSYQIILEVNYSDEQIESEQKRLTELGAYVNNDDFNYPAYVTLWNVGYMFEYVLFNGNTAVYVYLQLMSRPTIDNSYLPNGYPEVEGEFYAQDYADIGLFFSSETEEMK